MIDLVNVTLAHRGLPFLRNASLHIDRGEVVILTGETGSGKTSLFRALYGDMSIDSGAIRIDGFNLGAMRRKKLPGLRRRMGLIFQDNKLLEDRSVFENICFSLSIRMNSSLAIKHKALEILNELGLSHLRSKMPDQLSGGESQRVGMARALAGDPRIVLADEPTGNLDADTARDIFEYLKAWRTPERTFLIATHDVEHAFAAFPDARWWRLEDALLKELG